MNIISTLKALAITYLMTGILLGSTDTEAQGTWKKITNQSPLNGGGLMLLLSDGTLMVRASTNTGYGKEWMKLSPDQNGSYVNATWSNLASMHDDRLYYSAQVLNDGRVYIAGGEYGLGLKNAEVYNVAANTWSNVIASGHSISDASSQILPNGLILQSLVEGSQTGTLLFDPKTNTYSAGPNTLKNFDEATWVKLPDESILFVDLNDKSSERYIPSLNKWIADAPVLDNLYNTSLSETGPDTLLPDGRVFYVGGSGKTALYTPSGDTTQGYWEQGPTIPNNLGASDAPGVMLPNGKYLFVASPIGGTFTSPTSFFEYDYRTNQITQISSPDGNNTVSSVTYTMCFVNLPDGNVMYNKSGSKDFYIYVPDGNPISEGKPVITSVKVNNCNAGKTYTITGHLFNGISEGACYGDDWQMASNYPIIRLINGNNVYFAKTSNWNSTSVMRGNKNDTAQFTLPANLPDGLYKLVLSVNGISADTFLIRTPSNCNIFPQVSVSSPNNKSVFATNTNNINLVAQANDVDGTINIVKFYNGNQLIGTCTNQPYTVNFNNLINGYYYISAVAIDNSGDSTKSIIDTIIIGNQNPTVQITSPINGYSNSQPAVLLINTQSADIDGTVVKVELYNGNQLLATLNNSPFNFQLNALSAGSYSLIAKAYDNEGSIGISNLISITITNIAPKVLITSPNTNTSFVGPADVTINALTSDLDGTITKVEFYNNHSLIGTDNTYPFEYQWNGLTAGTYTITAKAYDNSGANAISSKVIFSVINSCNSIVWSSSDIYLTGNKVSLNGHNYTCNWWSQNNRPDLNIGQWSDNGTCTTKNLLPNILITIPQSSDSITEGDVINLTVNASDPDGSIDSVRYYLGTQYIGTSTISPFDIQWTSVIGNYELIAVAYDHSKLSTTSQPVHFKVNPLATYVVVSNSTGLTVYPNPTSGIIFLESGIDIVEVRSFDGKELIIQYAPNTQIVDLQNIQEGLYLLKMVKNNKVYTEKIIKL